MGTLARWQSNNSGIDTGLRIGLPVVGIYLFTHGHHAAAVGLVGAAGVLWANRLTTVNL